MPSRLYIQALGELDVQPYSLLPRRFGRKAQALLIYLTIEQKNQSVDKLLTMFWNGVPKSRNRLDNELTYVRKLFADGSLPIRDGIVQWNIAQNSFYLDVFAFEAYAQKASIEDLEEAVKLYRNYFWADCTVKGYGPEFDDWLFTQRQYWQELFLVVLEKLCLNSPHRMMLAREHLVRLLQIDPTHEQVNRIRIRYLLQNGRINKALQTYNQYTHHLQKEFGASPTVAMQRMYRRILAARDGHEPAFLPPLSTIVGRSEELKNIESFIARSDCRLITIVGPGGIGKTRLAQEAASEAQNIFLDGVCFIDLTAVSKSQLIYSLADAFNISLHGQKEPEATLITQMQHDERLLVLDSFETQLPEGRQLVNRLLSAIPGLNCIITSRERLNLRGEWLVPLEGLSLLNDHNEKDSTQMSAAVQLFLQRARQSQPTFSPNLEEYKYIAQICSLSAGMPLAIELAAYWTRFHSCAEIMSMLRENMSSLNRKGMDYPARHQNIKAAFDHSWHNLTESEQKIFAALAIFPGAISEEAVKTVVLAEQATIVSLINKSMVTPVNSGRIRIHPLLRQYGLGHLKLTPKMYESAQMRLIEYYSDFLSKHDLTNPTDQTIHLEEIALEIETIQFVWGLAIRLKIIKFILKLVHGLWAYYEVTGLFLLNYRRLSFALDQFLDEKFSSKEIQFVVGAMFARRAWPAFRLGRFLEGVQDTYYAVELLADLKIHGAQVEYARASSMGCLLNWYLGNFQKAKSIGVLAQAVFQNHPDSFGELQCELYLAFASEALGEYEASIDYYLNSIELGQAIGDHRSAYMACAKVSMLLFLIGDLNSAKSYFSQAKEEIQKIPFDPFAKALHLMVQAKQAFQQTNLIASQQHGLQALAICEEIGERWFALTCHLQLGEVLLHTGRFKEANHHYEKVISEAQAMSAAPVLLAGCSGMLIADWKRTQTLTSTSYQLLQLVAQHPALEQLVRDNVQIVLDTAVTISTDYRDLVTLTVQKKVKDALSFLANNFDGANS